MAQPDVPRVTRGGFLALVTGGAAAAVAAALGATGLAYFVSPLFKREKETWVDVGAAARVPRGVPTKVDFMERRRDAWVVNERRSSAWVLTENGADFTVFDPRCTHLGCPYHWNATDKQFLCPCHGGVFDERGNVVSGPPPRPLDRYPVKVRDGRLLIRPSAVKARTAA